MTYKRRWIRLLAVAGAFTMLAAACGNDDDDTTTPPDDETPLPDGDGLVIGYVLPQDGPLAFLGPPQIEGVKLAIEDINAAGGVLGTSVTLLEGNEGDSPLVAKETANRLVADGAHVIVGSAASSFTQEFIGDLFEAEIPQCSASNTSPAFSTQANAEFYMRTVPPDEAVAPIIADVVIGDNHESVVIVARADDYGEALASLVDDALGEQGATVVDTVSYNPEADNFAAEVEQAVNANADAVVLIAFDEGGDIIAGMLEQGIETEQIYGADGVFGPTLVGLVDETNPNVIDGMKVIGAAGDEGFNERIAGPTGNSFIYGGQAYDCTILLALAVEQVGSVDDGPAIVAAAKEISRAGGETCTTFAECAELIRDGEEVDYDGASGVIDLDDVGDPTAGRYAIGQFVDGVIEILDSIDVDLADL